MNKNNYLDTVRAVEIRAQNSAYDIMPLLTTPTKGGAQCNKIILRLLSLCFFFLKEIDEPMDKGLHLRPISTTPPPPTHTHNKIKAYNLSILYAQCDRSKQ